MLRKLITLVAALTVVTLASADQHAIPSDDVIGLDVDATDLAHKVFSVHETLPVSAGSDVTLLYPEWEPGSHAPTVDVASLAGLIITASGRRLEWFRDPLDPHAFAVHVPSDVSLLDIRFQYLSPVRGPVVVTSKMLDIQWQHMVLYPKGRRAESLKVYPALRLPAGFNVMTPLRNDGSGTAELVRFETVTLDRLIDSPVFAGRYTRRYVLVDGARPVELDLMADSPQLLDVPEDTLTRYATAARLTLALFGEPPWRSYHILASLSNALPSTGGVEHLESSENYLPPDYLSHTPRPRLYQDLIWHELVHAWNGKERTPAGMRPDDFNSPMRNDLLWVYEGLTQYWGEKMAHDAGLWTDSDYQDQRAIEIADALARPGRAWKSLADTSLDPSYVAGHRMPWLDWQRREDYYLEGPILWAEVDQTIRETSRGTRSLNDLASRFFGPAAAREHGHTYTLDDLCVVLNQLAAIDWHAFFTARLNAHDDGYLQRAVARSGWDLTWSTAPSPMFQELQKDSGASSFMYSLGLAIDDAGRIKSVAWQGLAFRAGVALDSRIEQVNGAPFSIEALTQAVATKQPLKLQVKQEGEERIFSLPYSDGSRYPSLRATGRQMTAAH